MERSKINGYIMLSGEFFEHPLWKEERSFSLAEAWLDLLNSARFEATPGKVIVKMKTITINRGELRSSIRFLAQHWGWSKDKVGRFMKMLEGEEMIRRSLRQGESIVKILNYDTYVQSSQPAQATGQRQGANLSEFTEGNAKVDGPLFWAKL